MSLSDSLGTLPVHASVANMSDKERRQFDALYWACSNMLPRMQEGANVRELCRAWSLRLAEEWRFKMGPEQLRKKLYAFKNKGSAGLRNGRLARKPAEKKLLHPMVIDEFWGIYLSMKDKASKEAAWRKLIERLIEGKAIGQSFTWQRLYMKHHAASDLPKACPYSFHNPPPGWSLTNFTTQQVPCKIAQALALEGMGSAKALLAKTAGIRIDWSSLRPLECLMIDDHDVDFRCLVAGQEVRLRLIVLRDVRTRRHLAYVVRPRLKDDDGTERSISRRDVMHLLSGFLFNYGLPKDFICYLHCENAAAAVSLEDEARLFRVTGGRFKIDRTGIFSGVVKLSSFKESGGTPTGKAIIESGFKLFDTELAHIRGATGSNYTKKHGEHEGRLRAAKKLVDRVRALPVESQNQLAELVKLGEAKFPFASLWEAHKEIALAIERMDARMWHDMEGFLRVTEFRTSPDSAIYYPLNRELALARPAEDQAIIAEFLTYPDSLRQRMLDWGRKDRGESSVECWHRLTAELATVSISRDALFELMLDGQTKAWPGTGEIMLEINKEKIFFRGRIEAEPNQKIRFNYNADAPNAVWPQDEAGRPLGTLLRVERLGYHDAEAKREHADFAATNFQRAFHTVRSLEINNPAEIEQFEDNAKLAKLLSHLEGEQGAPVPVATLQSETSTALVAEIQRSHKQPKPVNARRELARLRRKG